MSALRFCSFLLIVSLFSGSASAVFAQAASTPSPAPPPENPALFGTSVDTEGSSDTNGAQFGLGAYKKKNVPKKKKGELAVAPIPMINPSIGNGGGLGALYARHIGGENDTSPPSTFGMGGFGTANGSWGGGFGARLYLKNDKYRITVGIGGGQFNYNYFGTGTAGGDAGISIPLGQKSKAFLIEPKIRFYRRWYVGPRYHIIKNDVYLNSSKLNPEDLPIPLPSDLNLRTAALGARLQRDTSDSPFYPRSGSIIDVLGDLFGPAVGGQITYQNLTLTYNRYMGVGLKNVFAIHGSACLATAAAPFYDICQLGYSKDIRGYQIGQFRDNRMIVGQAEYRRELFWRFGAVAFAGAGAVAPTWRGFGDTSPEPGGGLGLRFILATKNHINLRADYAWGNGSHATYITLGEAF